MDITLRMSDHALTARAAAAAGIVLLKNTAGTLPLLPAEDGAPLPVAVFGIRQLLTPWTSAPCGTTARQPSSSSAARRSRTTPA